MSARYITQEAIETLQSNWNQLFHPSMMMYKDSYTIPDLEFKVEKEESPSESFQNFWN